MSMHPRANYCGPDGPLVYVASKTKHMSMWNGFRTRGYPIVARWLDFVGTPHYSMLWQGISLDVTASCGVVMYVAPNETLKGALIEVGMALGQGKRVAVILDRVPIDDAYDPIGSWLSHPFVRIVRTIDDGFEWVLRG